MVDHDIQDANLSENGRQKIIWAQRKMLVLAKIRERFEKEKPIRGCIVAACLHVTAETANLMLTLRDGGADVSLCASNPLSTQDDVAASLVADYGISVYAKHGENTETYYYHIKKVLKKSPDITMDDGADLISTLHREAKEKIPKVIGGTEETTTGVTRLRAMANEGALAYPVIAVNDAATKYLFDNRYGTGQSTIDGILRATNMLIAGSNFVVCGYGWCGKGVAMRARGMGAKVIVTEVDPLKALEAVMDGFQVVSIAEAAKIGDIFVTVTGNTSVLRDEHFRVMKDGAILANAGHFDVEIDIEGLKRMSIEKINARPGVSGFKLKTGRIIYIVAEGRLVNLSAAEGHPSDVMDMSFANQALSVEYLIKNKGALSARVYPVPDEIDRLVAETKLESMGIKIDRLTDEQKNYLSSWKIGT